MKLVYVAHPLGTGPDRDANRLRAIRWVKWVASLGHAPVADWIIYAQMWDDSHIDQALTIDVALVARCDEVWLCGGRVSPGMIVEREAAHQNLVHVVDQTHLGDEPPPDGDRSTATLRTFALRRSRPVVSGNRLRSAADLLVTFSENLRTPLAGMSVATVDLLVGVIREAAQQSDDDERKKQRKRRHTASCMHGDCWCKPGSDGT